MFIHPAGSFAGHNFLLIMPTKVSKSKVYEASLSVFGSAVGFNRLSLDDLRHVKVPKGGFHIEKRFEGGAVLSGPGSHIICTFKEGHSF